MSPRSFQVETAGSAKSAGAPVPFTQTRLPRSGVRPLGVLIANTRSGIPSRSTSSVATPRTSLNRGMLGGNHPGAGPKCRVVPTTIGSVRSRSASVGGEAAGSERCAYRRTAPKLPMATSSRPCATAVVESHAGNASGCTSIGSRSGAARTRVVAAGLAPAPTSTRNTAEQTSSRQYGSTMASERWGFARSRRNETTYGGPPSAGPPLSVRLGSWKDATLAGALPKTTSTRDGGVPSPPVA